MNFLIFYSNHYLNFACRLRSLVCVILQMVMVCSFSFYYCPLFIFIRWMNGMELNHIKIYIYIDRWVCWLLKYEIWHSDFILLLLLFDWPSEYGTFFGHLPLVSNSDLSNWFVSFQFSLINGVLQLTFQFVQFSLIVNSICPQWTCSWSGCFFRFYCFALIWS